MKFGTSFFNRKLLKKDCTRFAPVWGIYTLIMGIFMVTLLYRGWKKPWEQFLSTIPAWGIVNLVYALVCAELLFGDLFSSRLCYALHAMPLRREGWLLVHSCAGLLFSLVPNLLIGVLCLPALSGEISYVGAWLLAVELQYVFFFGTAVFCTMCTGNRLATAILYGIVNFISMIALWLAELLYLPQLYGIHIPGDKFMLLSPVCHLAAHEWPAPGGWGYLAAIAGVGLAFWLGSFLLYRRRPLEAAGDFVAFRWVASPFRIVYTICVGMLFWGVWNLFLGTNGDGYLFLLVGMALGYFTGQMMIKRQVRVFRLRSFLGFAALAAVLFGSVFVVKLDPLGVTRYVPDPEDVVMVRMMGSPQFYSEDSCYITRDPEEITDLADLHSGYVAVRGKEEIYAPFSIEYTFKNGRTVRRYYSSGNRALAGRVTYYLSKPEFVLDYENWEDFVKSVSYIMDEWSNILYVNEDEEIRSLLEALRADCEAGRIVYENWAYPIREEFDTDTHANLTLMPSERMISITRDCTATLNWLQSHGYTFDEYGNLCEK